MGWLEQTLRTDDPAGQLSPPAKHQALGKAIAAEFYIRRVVPAAEADAHVRGDWHIHGLGDYGLTPHSAIVPLQQGLRSGVVQGPHVLGPARDIADLPLLTSTLILGVDAETHEGLCVPGFDAAWAEAIPPDTSPETIETAVKTFLQFLGIGALGRPTGRLTLQLGPGGDARADAVTRALLKFAEEHSGEPCWRNVRLAFATREGAEAKPDDPHFELLTHALRVAARHGSIDLIHGTPVPTVLAPSTCLPQTPEKPHGIALCARISLNLPRLAMQGRRQGFETAELLPPLLEQAAVHLQRRVKTLSQRPEGAFHYLPKTFPAMDHKLTHDDMWKTPRVAINLVGLAQALLVLSGQHHGFSPSAQAEGMNLVKTAGERAAMLSRDLGLDILLQGTPASEAAQRFIRLDRREFGILRGITDREAYSTGVAVPDGGANAADLSGSFHPHLRGGLRHDVTVTEETAWPLIQQCWGSGLSWLHLSPKK
jgi:ribonucleoside-triphosphate reductase